MARTSSAIGAAAYALYMYYQLVEKPLSVYPPAAAAQVKEALYHASRGDAARMATAFKEAIRYAEESGMHPLSNEVAGLKIECAQLLLNIRDGELAGKAVAVLERVLDENVAGAEYFAQQGRWADRTNVLKRAVLLGYKIGEIYQQLGKDPDAEEAMAWSTETLLKEVSRREDRRADAANEGDWFDDVAMSACFESSLPSPLSLLLATDSECNGRTGTAIRQDEPALPGNATVSKSDNAGPAQQLPHHHADEQPRGLPGAPAAAGNRQGGEAGCRLAARCAALGAEGAGYRLNGEAAGADGRVRPRLCGGHAHAGRDCAAAGRSRHGAAAVRRGAQSCARAGHDRGHPGRRRGPEECGEDAAVAYSVLLCIIVHRSCLGRPSPLPPPPSPKLLSK